jgi:hypothetical protein
MKDLMRVVLLVCACGSAPSAIAQGQPESSTGAGSSPAGESKDAEPPSKITKLFVGLGVGGGFNASAKINGRSASFDDQLQGADNKSPLISVNLVSLGIAVTQGLYLGAHVSAVAQSANFPGNIGTQHLQITNYMAAATWFPYEGLFLRAGVGPSVFVASNQQQTQRTTGLGFLLGGGVGLNLAGPHNVTLSVEQSWQSYSGTDAAKPKSSQAGAIFLGYMYKN